VHTTLAVAHGIVLHACSGACVSVPVLALDGLTFAEGIPSRR